MDLKKRFAEIYKAAMRAARYGDWKMATYFQGHLDALTEISITYIDSKPFEATKIYEKMNKMRQQLSERRYE